MGPVSHKAARHLHMDVHDYFLRISNIHTLLHQASKWGICGMQGSFPHLKRQLPLENSKRRNVLERIVFVHNLRTDFVRMNQIKIVFDLEYK